MSELNNILHNGKGKLTEEKLNAYLEGRLTAKEQHEVEQWLADEGMEADAIEGLKNITANETAFITQRINLTLQKELHKKSRRRTKAIIDNNWAWIAVIIVLMLCIVAYVLMHYSIPTNH
jgi:ferric-dicitrate binding protein FerR (iron transport regulator)